MQALFNIINIPFSYVLRFLSNILGGNFAAAVFLFTVLINIIFIPLSIKSQKSTVQQTRLKPKLDDLKKRFGDDKRKYSEATQKLYQEEGISMSGGCLPMILRLVVMMSIYYLIMKPLTYLTTIDKSVIDAAAKALDLKTNNTAYQLKIIEAVNNGKYQSAEITQGLKNINFKLFGIDLTQTPKFNLDIFHKAELIWLIPVCAFLAQMLTSVISMKIQKYNNPEAPNMAGMLLTMPLISLFIGFGLPGGVGFYWICSSLIGGLVQSAVQILYGPHKMLARERSKELSKQIDFEKKQIAKFSNSETEE